MRLDRAAVERGLARSRSHAADLIAAGSVLVNGLVTTKAALDVGIDDALSLAAPDPYVSRAAHKLVGVLDELAPLGLAVAGRAALDAGASTGGFTQVLLERGATHVTAIDVGHGQLAPAVASDPRVTAVEGLNVRDLAPGGPGSGADLVTSDLSFISLRLAIGPLASVAQPGADFVLLIKPQFELERAALDKHGVVTRAVDRAAAVSAVCASLAEHGLAVLAVRPSVLPGPSGNVEFFVWARSAWHAKGAEGAPPPLAGDALERAIAAMTEGRP